jgi:molybdate transport system regulatory protein
MTVRVQFRLRFMLDESIALGPGKIALIESIARTGSISAAAREHAMSYRRAWLLIEQVNACFEEALVSTATGGKGGGGASLTEFGQEIVRLYREAEAAAHAAAKKPLAAITRRLKRSIAASDSH